MSDPLPPITVTVPGSGPRLSVSAGTGSRLTVTTAAGKRLTVRPRSELEEAA